MKFFRIPFQPDEDSGNTDARNNRLQKYIHAQSVQDMSRLAGEISPEVRQLIGANVQALLGYLPTSEFNTTVVASKENLQNLLASAMLTGFFMHAMETRMQMESVFADDGANDPSQGAPSGELQDPATLFSGEPLNESESPSPRAFSTDDPDLRDFLAELQAPAAEKKPSRTEADLDRELLDLLSEPEAQPTGEPPVDAPPGRFLSQHELETDNSLPEKLNIQLEISTRMNRSELARLLRELREFQGRQQDDDEE